LNLNLIYYFKFSTGAACNASLVLGTCSFIYQGISTKTERSEFVDLRVKLPPV